RSTCSQRLSHCDVAKVNFQSPNGSAKRFWPCRRIRRSLTTMSPMSALRSVPDWLPRLMISMSALLVNELHEFHAKGVDRISAGSGQPCRGSRASASCNKLPRRVVEGELQLAKINLSHTEARRPI